MLAELLKVRGIDLTEKQQQQFAQYYQELIVWNEKMNLTAIVEEQQVYIKHFYDSLTLAFVMSFKEISSLADIGAGAGFPSIPLKIIYPHLRITIVDSLNKRISFLTHLVSTLKLDHVRLVHGRAEELGRLREYRDSFDVVTARAVARLNVLNELCLPFVRTDGRFIAMKGSDPRDEISEAEKSFKQLNGVVEKIESFTLPMDDAIRNIVLIRKTDRTPYKYPRNTGTPLKKPLV